VRCAGCFVADLRIPDCLEAAFVRSDVAHGELRGVSLGATRHLPGVVAAWARLPLLPPTAAVSFVEHRRTHASFAQLAVAAAVTARSRTRTSRTSATRSRWWSSTRSTRRCRTRRDGDPMRVTLTVNGERRDLDIEPRRTLADALREDCGLTGTHLACEHGVCGACTVIVDGEAVRSCLMFAVQCDGAAVRTVEGLAHDGTPHPLQEAFSAEHALQCGFCTPGFPHTRRRRARAGCRRRGQSGKTSRVAHVQPVPVHRLRVDPPRGCPGRPADTVRSARGQSSMPARPRGLSGARARSGPPRTLSANDVSSCSAAKSSLSSSASASNGSSRCGSPLRFGFLIPLTYPDSAPPCERRQP
jgi:aerobic-type carbon monoxide dehydrogenase small subunit (CoxS/CutS family)